MTRTLVFLFAFAGIGQLAAQTENTWQGGFPGHENDWGMAVNWDQNRVPNEFDIAVIPDCSTHGDFYPQIWTEQPTVYGLRLLSGASLYIAPGAILAVDSGDMNDSGVLLQGALFNHGRFLVVNQPGSVHAAADKVRP